MGSLSLPGLCPSCGERGSSLRRLLRLPSTHLQGTQAAAAVAHGLRCSETCGVLPDQGSNPCVLHWQAETWPLGHQGIPATIPVVLSPSQCLLDPRKCRAALSVGAGPRRVSPLLSRLQSTPWTLYWPPDHGPPRPNPILSLLPVICKYSPISENPISFLSMSQTFRSQRWDSQFSGDVSFLSVTPKPLKTERTKTPGYIMGTK